MSLIVQKFGGTSVADTKKILAAARKAVREVRNGNQVVMVVSAMGKNTDHLINLAKEISEEPNSREMDMLMSTGEQVTISLMAIAIQSLGHQAVSFTGAQIGIRTDSSYSKARIRSISTDRMRNALGKGQIVIVAGFQGVDDDFNITTLGRGGSDTTAVALAAVLKADSCDIFTDVDGVYTTDPRVVPEARKVDKISYDEMLELASLGAGVMHSRSIEFAKKFHVPVHVRSSFSDNQGTLIGSEPENAKSPVCGAALAKEEARVTVIGVPDKPGVAMSLFSRIAEARIPTDMIVQNVSESGKTDISFVVPCDDLSATLKVVEAAVQEIGAEGFESDDNVAKVSVVGLGMKTQPGVAQKMFHAFAEKKINIHMISTSEIKISALVDRKDAVEALRAVHAAFQLQTVPTSLDETSETVVAPHNEENVQNMFSNQFFDRLTGMEDILIESVSLDQSQSRITLTDLPDRPGLAAEVFDQIAAGRIIVDMIVQSVGRLNLASISFTVPRDEWDAVLNLTQKLNAQYRCKTLSNPTVSKLTVRGTGLRSHTGLAYRMFKTLSDQGINVSIICTSERCVNVVVDDANGPNGLALLSNEFCDDMI